MAAYELLCTGRPPASVRTPLPPFSSGGGDAQDAVDGLHPRAWMDLAVQTCHTEGADTASATVIKDGGDDPDVTSGALIRATVSRTTSHGECPPPSSEGHLRIEGGPGVGRITLPGLPLPVGAWAINPVPRRQIAFALEYLRKRFAESALSSPPFLTVCISVENGEAIAKRTFNPRLGIRGGISILGTQGTVRPFSNTAFKATISEQLDLAEALSCKAVIFSTGRRSEQLLMARYPTMPQHAFIQVADFAGFSLEKAARKHFPSLIWGCFFGKLVKLAQGEGYTHARESALDMSALARICKTSGVMDTNRIAACVTANQALELLLGDQAGHEAVLAIALRAARTLEHFAGNRVTLHLFHLDGRELLKL
ncbi:MAG: cobalt-precorrin-5B (C(1))-methyltransferase CbiD [Desulfovibrio sp.]|nr:cobalt-precorrin-5B (C(1))-methyltransferase CbiD [Desulfovibrio sp.]